MMLVPTRRSVAVAMEVMFSTKKLYIGPGSDDLPFRAGGVFLPFPSPATVTADTQAAVIISDRLPTLCSHCGGYLNQFCQINHEANGTWKCSLCYQSNRPFFSPITSGSSSSSLHQYYPELTSSCLEYHEDLLSSKIPHSIAEDHIRIFAIDTILCHLPDTFLFFQSLFQALPSTTRVGIIAYGKNINILRLCGGERDGVIVADVISGVQLAASSSYHHLFTQGEYLTPAHNALNCLDDIITALSTLVDDTTTNMTLTRTTLTCLVSVICSFNQSNAAIGIRGLLIVGRSMPYDSSSSSSHSSAPLDEMRILQYASLGREACLSSRVWLDAVVIGMHAIELSSFDSLCTASGGSVLGVSYNFSEPSLLQTISHSTKRTADQFPSSVGASIAPTIDSTASLNNVRSKFAQNSATLEIRTNPCLLIEKLTGTMNDLTEMTASSHSGPGASLSPAVSRSPSSSYRQSVLHEIVQDLLGNSLSQYSQSYLMRLVDLTHLEHTLQQSASVTAPSSSSRNPIDENHLQKHYRELLARNIESETVSCVEILRLSPEMAYSVIFEPTNELSIDKHGVVQMVLRYVNQAGVKVTQISTFKLETTDDVYEYQRLFDEDIWISMVARDLVGELHYSSDPLQLQVQQQQQHQPSTDTLAAMIQGSEGLCTLSCLSHSPPLLVGLLIPSQRSRSPERLTI
jgi:hypothetical protein